jgi:hypothetical protein
LVGAGGSVGLAGNVRGILLIKVPYPGKYEVINSFETTNANKGDPVNITMSVSNLGKEGIGTEAHVVIFNEKNKSVETYNLGSATIQPANSYQFFGMLSTTNYQPGDYRAEGYVDYDGGQLKAQSLFRLGTLFVGISNYSKEFERNQINQFNIEAESFWNDPIRDVPAEVKIIGHEIEFSTPSVNLDPWKKQQLNGFFDTTGIEEKKFKANITLYYQGKSSSQIVNLKFKRETDYALYALIGGGIFLGILVIATLVVLIVIMVKIRKNGREKEDNNNRRKNHHRK